MQKSLLITPELCTSCLQCEMACSFEHEGVFNPSKSRIKVFEFEHGRRAVPYTCTQCADAVCVGCKVCTIACPFGTVNYDKDSGKVIKCDLCGGEPKCAEVCPTDAITYVDANWTGYDRMRQWAASTDNQPNA